MKICVHCEEEINGSYKMQALDRPYRNLFFHPDCYNAIVTEYGTGVEGMLQYLTQTYEKWYNMEENIGKRSKNARKRRGKPAVEAG